jgi:signal transduction histidine kinase
LEALAKYQKQGQLDEDYAQTLEQIVALKDTFYLANSAQAIAEMQTKYEVQRKETLIASQKLELLKRNFIIGGLVASALFAAMLAFYLFRRNKRRQNERLQKAVEIQRQKNAAEVKSAEEQERRRIAADLHDNLGAYASSIASGIGYLGSIQQEEEASFVFRDLQHNAQLIISQLKDTIWALKKDSLRLTEISDRLKVFVANISKSYPQFSIDAEEQIQTDHQLSASQAFHLYRIVQEGINNALRHSEGTEINIRFKASHNWLVQVEDNGKGPGEWVELTHESMGLQNIKDRCRECGWKAVWVKNADGGTRMEVSNTSN